MTVQSDERPTTLRQVNELLDPFNLPAAVSLLADVQISAMTEQPCLFLSGYSFFLRRGGVMTAPGFERLMSTALARHESIPPRQ
jgi:hypothetical protein